MDVHVDQSGEGETAGEFGGGQLRFGIADIGNPAVRDDDGRGVPPLLRGIDQGDAGNLEPATRGARRRRRPAQSQTGEQLHGAPRSEERRVGKECRSRWSPYPYKTNEWRRLTSQC